MKYLFILLSFGLMSCNSQKITKVKKASEYDLNDRPYAQAWVGGAPGSGGGVDLYLPASLIINGKLQAVYFRGMTSTQLTFTNNIKNMTLTKFYIEDKEDLIMDVDPTKEMQNQAPEEMEFPFPLEDDEAVVAVERDGKTQYIKVTDIEERALIAYPQAPPR